MSRPVLHLKRRTVTATLRDLNLYLWCYRKGFLFDISTEPPLPDYQGYGVVEAFHLADAKGRLPAEIPCNHPEMLRRALIGKKQLNANIRQWAEGFAEWTLAKEEFKEWFPRYPEWVWEAIEALGRAIRYRPNHRTAGDAPCSTAIS